MCYQQDGTVLPPAILEEGAVRLERKGGLWPFGKPSDDLGGTFQRGIE